MIVGKSIKKNTIYNTIKTTSSILFPLISFSYANRVLLPENVGKVNFALSIISYFSLIASLGINTYAIRECSAVRNDKEKLNDLASQIFSINIVSTIIAYIALFVTLLAYRKLDSYRILILIQSLSIIANTIGADWLNSAMEDFRYITLRTVRFQVLSLALTLIFVHKPEDYIRYAIIALISSSGASIANAFYRRRYCTIRLVGLRKGIEWNRHIRPIVFLFSMILAQTIFNSVDSTMLGIMHGDKEVGIYSVAHKVLMIINQVVGSLLLVIIPRMSYYFAEDDYEAANKLLTKVFGFNMLLGLPIVVGVLMTSEEIIGIVAGPDYAESIPVLRILILGFAFSLVGGNFIGNAILLPSKQEKYYMIVCCVSAVINIILNYVLIPWWGARAAALTTVICSATIMILLFLKVDKRIHIDKILLSILSPMVGCGLIVATCLLFRSIQNTYTRTVISIGISATLYFITQILLRNELVIEVLDAITHKIRKGSRDFAR